MIDSGVRRVQTEGGRSSYTKIISTNNKFINNTFNKDIFKKKLWVQTNKKKL